MTSVPPPIESNYNTIITVQFRLSFETIIKHYRIFEKFIGTLENHFSAVWNPFCHVCKIQSSKISEFWFSLTCDVTESSIACDAWFTMPRRYWSNQPGLCRSYGCWNISLNRLEARNLWSTLHRSMASGNSEWPKRKAAAPNTADIVTSVSGS